VDLNNPNRLTTLFSVNNASTTAALVHVVVWSDLSVPVLDFNIYLTGYDVQSVNLRDNIVNGNMPHTHEDRRSRPAVVAARPAAACASYPLVSRHISSVACGLASAPGRRSARRRGSCRRPS
jgi:hypothetical protein